MPFDAHANFAISTVAVAPAPASSGTTLTVGAGQGGRFPAVSFNATVCQTGVTPDPTNSEIVRVTARATDSMTIVRAQEGTAARGILVGDTIFAGVTAKTLTDMEGGGATFNTQTVSYVLVAADAGKVVEMNSASVTSVTIPPNASVNFPVGTEIEVVQAGTGAVSIAPGAGVTINSLNGVTTLSGQYATVSLIQTATNVWLVAGALGVAAGTAARAYRNAAFSFAATAWTKVPMDTLSFDTATNMDVATNHRFNVPTTGRYQVNVQLNLSMPAQYDTVYVSIYKNGAEASRGMTEQTPELSQVIGAVAVDILSCTAGDYLEPYVLVSTSGAPAISLNGAVTNYFSVAKVA